MAAQIPTYAPPEEFTLEQLRAMVPPAPPPATAAAPTIEVVGRRTDTLDSDKQQIALEMAVAEAVLPHQLHEVDNLVEILHLQELLEEREARVSLLTMDVIQWRERALAESNARRREAASGHDRERDLIRVIHTQMTTIDTAEAATVAAQMRVRELECKLDEFEVVRQRRSRRWWRP